MQHTQSGKAQTVCRAPRLDRRFLDIECQARNSAVLGSRQAGQDRTATT
jgi:hypothetical protein